MFCTRFLFRQTFSSPGIGFYANRRVLTAQRRISSDSFPLNLPRTERRPRVIFSGIQPTGIPHLGNLLGALANWVKLQNSAEPEDDLFFSIVGWHALTLPQDPHGLASSRSDMLAVLLAMGLDPKRSNLFHQDENQNHVELAWVLNCLTPMGKLRRMTTWKSRLAASRNANDESEVNESMLNVGLFAYPVLQAADILAYQATHVPVGEDQQQHLELCRDLADVFNRSFQGEPLFPLPEPVITPSRRILSLRDPASKMSKSAADVHSRILLTDNSTQIRSKIRSAVTDSISGINYDPRNRPGTSNLLTILAACANEDVGVVAERYASKGHGDLKADVIDAIEELLKRPRAEFGRLRLETEYLKQVADECASKARARSDVTLRDVRLRIGLSV